MMRIRTRGAWQLPLFLVAALTFGSPALAAEYTVGVEDVLQVSVYLHPELDKSVTVASDGNVTLAPIGQVKAAGLTVKQLSDRLSERVSTYLRQTTTVSVTVSQYLSRSVYVVGQVGKPGRYGFENIPGLVDLLSQAGGALPGADLSRVQIIRREGEARRVIFADVSSALRDGIGSDLPPLRPGDTIVLSSSGAGGYTGTPGDAIAVLGEVARPGLFPAGSGIDLFMLLAQAGGFTPRANLKLVRIVTTAPNGSMVKTVDLKESLSHAGSAPVLVRPGEVVFVTPSGTSAGWAAFATVMAVSRDILNIALAVDVIKRNGE